MRPRITFIGGGSFLWMPTLIRDCCLTPELAGHGIVLHDVAPEPLHVMEQLARKMIGEFGADLTVASTTDRSKALDGARFVVIGIAVGGLSAMKHDLDITRKYGVRHPVGDSAGPAGISRALRNIPVFHGIGRDVANRCPGAWVLNLSNPMSVLTRALTLTPGVRAAGVCHGLREGAEFIREICGIESPESVRIDAAGINHFSWAVRLSIGDRDGWPVLRAAIRRKGGGKLAPFRLDAELFLKHGAFPLFPDRHTAEFLDDEIGPGSGYGRRYGLKFTTIADRRHNLGLRKAKVRKWLQGPVPWEKSDEEVTRVMAAIVAGKPFEAVLNLPNRGQFAAAPGDAVVESFGIADGLGLRPYVTPDLPPAVKDLVLAHIASQEMAIKAALAGSRELAREAFALDPVTRGVRRSGEMVDRLLAANRELLPLFFKS